MVNTNVKQPQLATTFKQNVECNWIPLYPSTLQYCTFINITK